MFNYELSTDIINKKLKSDGFAFFESIIDVKLLNNIHNELELWNFKFNSNKLSPVINKHSFFYSNALASSKTLLKLITHKKILEICSLQLGKKFRLKAHRVYNLQKHYKFPWHTDNKAVEIKNDSKGIVFIIYLDDVISGENQVIRGTHLTSHIFKGNTIDDNYIMKNYKNDIVSLKGKKGSLIIFNQSIIHRGKPITDNKTRNAIFFQIDTNINNAENLLLNPSFLDDNILKNCKNFLGFNKPSTFPTSPDNTSLATIPPKNLLFLAIKVPFYILKFYVNFIRSKFPQRLKNFIKSKIRSS